MLRRIALAALLLLAAAAPPAPPPEPAGFWTGPLGGPVPETITGGTVLPDYRAAQFFIYKHRALPIDVSPAPIRPLVMKPGLPWLPPPHQDLPGSAWLPGAGAGALPPDRTNALLATVDKLTGGDKRHFLVVYCHPNCWASWNAAKRLLQAGYRHVAWYPGGIEDWQSAQHPTQRTEPTVF
jgi:PQQ-dependent catabolism-associated CXXCW motif protein